MNTTLWLQVIIGLPHYNNVHMHKILLCGTTINSPGLCHRAPEPDHFTHSQDLLRTLSLYISFVLHSSFLWSKHVT